MATQLIKHLIDCATKDAIYKPLEAQWAFDERLIAKALQTVGTYFPHYSRHDESHSRQILVHIERLLGEDNIAQLTATDTWLLLEAAYLHDIGMVISDEHLNKDFDEIKKHVEKTRHTASGDSLKIMDALLACTETNASAIFARVDIHPFHAIKLLREIIADYYRAEHPNRADHIITTPLNIGLDSPRNELLPSRFFGLLGKICANHGADFKKVMDELPQQQVGIGTDDCHPRFIACLLRLGDLLDLDDNRFCPVMLKMAGKLPALSETHRQKHLAIRHFRADRERIEIEADCPSYDSYIATSEWFGWLREEVKNQMSRWVEIVPSRNFGLLPSVGDLKAHLKDWQVFSENQRPQFNLDRDRIFELLQGAGLYECKEQAMRELLQNAVDATLIRIWREHGEDCMPKPESFIERNSAPRSENVRKILDNYSIDVTIEKEKEEDQYNYWRITIADQGTGISKDDLKFMMQMGSSKKNHKRRAIIEKMPVWMKPSGIFGIGLHSVFLLTDEVIIETRSIDTGETLVIRLTNPTNEKEHGNVYFQVISESREIDFQNGNKQKFEPWNFSRYGCQLKFSYKTYKNNLPKISLYHFRLESVLNRYDGLIDTTGDFQMINLVAEIDNFFNFSFIIGNIKSNIKDIETEPRRFSPETEMCFYTSTHNLELLHLFISANPHINFYYRGQLVKNDNTNCFLNLIGVTVNLLDKDADKLLTIDRNKFRDGEEQDRLPKRIGDAIQDFFNSETGSIFYSSSPDDTKARIAGEYEIQGWQKQNYFIDYRKTIVWIKDKDGNSSSIKLEELENHDIIFFFINNSTKEKELLSFLKEKSDGNYTYKEIFEQDGVLKLIRIFLNEHNFNSIFLVKNSIEILKVIKNKEQRISNDLLSYYCKNKIQYDTGF